MQQDHISLGFSVGGLIDQLRLPALVLGLDLRVRHANASLLDLPGHPAVGDRLADHLCGADQFRLTRFLDDAIDSDDAPTASALDLVTQAGLHLHLTPLRDDRNGLLGLLCQADLPQSDPAGDMWRATSDTQDHGLWQLDVPSFHTTLSVGWYQMRGLTPDPGHSRDMSRIVADMHPGDTDRVHSSLEPVLKGTVPNFSLEYRVRHAEGHYFWVLSRGSVVKTMSDGRPMTIVGSDTNITSAHDAQRQLDDLRKRELRWKVAVYSADQGVWDHDLVNDNRFLSTSWYHMRGLDPDNPSHAQKSDWIKTLHPDDQAHVLAEIAAHDRGDTDTINYQYRHRHADGRWIWILSRGRVVARTPDGRPARVIGTDTDISDLKNAVFEHHRTSERLRIALRAANMGRWEHDLTTGRTYWDNRILEMLGITDGQNDRGGDDWNAMIHPDDRARTLAASARSVETKSDLIVDYRVLRPDGSICYLRSMAIFVEDQNLGSYYVGINLDITEHELRAQELEAARARMEYESHHDVLTGLANRRALDAFSLQTVRNLPGVRQAVLHLDLDNFKQINDTLGHAAGDAVLVRAASVLRRHVQDGWMAARVGGDEFVILIPTAPDEDALRNLARAIIKDMAEPLYYNAQACNFGTSIGIVADVPDDAAGKTLFVDADLALYAAKKDGRGRCAFFDKTMRQAAEDRKIAFDALLAGFDNDEIHCHYQPQFDAQTLRLSGVEALARWQSPTQGLLTPDKFLGTATELGMIAEIDALVLAQSQADLAKWQALGHDIPRISVNVSAARLADPGLARQLRDMALPNNRFAFELLESAFLDDLDPVVSDNLRALTDLGIEVEIDDFGTGHASIVSLLHLSPDRLKIDRQLIAPIVSSIRQRELVRTIIRIGHMQGVKVVAEGVETMDHVAILKSLKCDFLQGYGLARPMPAAAITTLLDDLAAHQGSLLAARDQA